MRPPVIQARGLTKTFRRGSEDAHAVLDADFEVREGELVALVGPSGSGKTTILNLLVGWEDPDAGEILYRGAVHSRLSDVGWNEIALVPQSLGLLSELTIAENVALPYRLGGLEETAPSDVDDLLDELGLTALADRSPDEVSLGEQQRAALARGLVGNPRLLLSDEPSGHQDAVWARGIFRSLRKACSQGTACVVATHNEEVLSFVDRVLQMHDGAIAATDLSPKELDGPH